MKNVPLRSQEERMSFCDAYFAAVGAKTTRAADGYREYELPRDVDKELTDRPFYWMWVEQTGQDVPPTTLRLAFNQDSLVRENERLKQEARAEAEKQQLNDIQRMFFRPPTAELITLGSFRLDKIYASLDTRGRFCCVAPANARLGSHFVPWLMVNATVSHRCDLVEQSFVSLGICLTNGQVVERFYDMVSRIAMNPVAFSSLARSRSMPISEAVNRAKHYLESMFAKDHHSWAESARQRLDKELRQVRTYYQSILPDVPDPEKPLVHAEQQRKERELKDRTEPRIEVVPKQLAVVGLVER